MLGIKIQLQNDLAYWGYDRSYAHSSVVVLATDLTNFLKVSERLSENVDEFRGGGRGSSPCMLEHIDGECARKFFVPNKFLAIS